MKLTITTLKEKEDAYEYRSGIKFDLATDTPTGTKENAARFLDGGEPEDNSLGRDWNDVYTIKSLILDAYEAGKRGEELELTEVEEDIEKF